MTWEEPDRRRSLFRFLNGQGDAPPDGAESPWYDLMRALFLLTPVDARLLLFEQIVDDKRSQLGRTEALRGWCVKQPNPLDTVSEASLASLVDFAKSRLEAAQSATPQMAARFVNVLADAVGPVGLANGAVVARLLPVPDLEYLSKAPDQRLELVGRLLTEWCRPIQASDGISEAMLRVIEARVGQPLPKMVRQWLGKFGAATDLWDRQDRVIRAYDMHIDDDGYFNLLHDSEYEVHWQIADTGAEDPAVWLVGAETEIQPEATTFSEFAVQTVLSQIKWQDELWYAQNGEVMITPELTRRLKSHYPECDVARACWPDLTRWFAAEDLLVEVSGRDTGWLWVTARTEVAARHFDYFFGTLVGFQLM